MFAAGVTAGVGGSAAKSQSKSRVVSSFDDMLAVCELALHNMRYYFGRVHSASFFGSAQPQSPSPSHQTLTPRPGQARPTSRNTLTLHPTPHARSPPPQPLSTPPPHPGRNGVVQVPLAVCEPHVDHLSKQPVTPQQKCAKLILSRHCSQTPQMSQLRHSACSPRPPCRPRWPPRDRDSDSDTAWSTGR